jgi:hypothetical protein
METSIFVTDLAQQFSLSVVGPSHSVVVSGWPEQAACQQLASSFCQTHVTTLLQEWPAFRFRAAPPGDDPTLIDRVAG